MRSSSVSLLPIAGIQRAKHLITPAAQTFGWQCRTLAGRLSELSGEGAAAILTLAFDLVVDAQRAEDPCAWLTTRQSAFYPPDAAARGVDLEAMVVVRATHRRSMGRAADQLGRSSAFGLIVVDLASTPPQGNAHRSIDPLPMPLQSRLLGLAQRHDIALVFLTRKGPDEASLSPLISLRVEARRLKRSDGSQACEAHVIKDKRHAPGWRHTEVCLGPAGLR